MIQDYNNTYITAVIKALHMDISVALSFYLHKENKVLGFTVLEI